ncbi:MAG: hypothetical protein HYV32_05155 [Candidatus Kerfeldbacteria bacterium]|nr:hypothetical protein [Candidatus Kerfeldbacteria bacterium]
MPKEKLDDIDDLKDFQKFDKSLVLERINEIIPQLPKMIGGFAGMTFFVMASLLQVVVNAIARPHEAVTFLHLLFGLLISYAVAFIAGFLVMRRAKNRIRAKLKGKGIIDDSKL